MHSENGYGTVDGMWSLLNCSGTGDRPVREAFPAPAFPPARAYAVGGVADDALQKPLDVRFVCEAVLVQVHTQKADGPRESVIVKVAPHVHVRARFLVLLPELNHADVDVRAKSHRARGGGAGARGARASH